MPRKANHPLGGQSPYDLRIRPNIFKPLDFDEAIDRHGQPVRWLKAQPCPVIKTTGQHDLKCQVCHGRGEIYDYQRDYWYEGEESPHGLKDPNVGQADKVVFWDAPVRSVKRVYKLVDGGVIEYPVVSHDERSAIISAPDGHCLPEYYDPIRTDYSVDLWSQFSCEFDPDGFIYRLPLKDDEFITKISVARHKSLESNLKVNSFNVRTVYLDSLPSGKIEIRGYKSRCAIMAIMPFESSVGMNLKSYEHVEGDMIGLCSDSYRIGKGDVITSLVMKQRSPELLVRGEGPFDLMAYYDVAEIDGDILDEDGIYYANGVDFVLWDYNKIRWMHSQPRVGARYSVSPIERLTWRVFGPMPESASAQGRLFPNSFHLKKLTKNNPGTLQPGVKNEDRMVGDWSGKFRLQ